MKVAVGEFELREIAVAAPGPDEAIVRTTLSTICGSDLHFLHRFPMPRGVEYVPMGHEAVGLVASLGSNVSGFSVGDRVVASCTLGCGKCPSCQVGHHSVCSGMGKIPGISNVLAGCQGEYFRVPSAAINMLRVPDALTDEQAIFAGDIMSTGFAAVERAEVGVGDSVAIFAQGPVGLCATAAARARGAGLVIGVEGVPERAALALRLGANHVVSPNDAVEAIMELTDGGGVDVAIEAVGRQESFEAATAVARLDGTVSSVGVYASEGSLTLPTAGGFYQRRFVTSLCPGGSNRLARLFHVLQFGRVDLTCLFTHRMSMADVVGAYEAFERRQDGVVKIALLP